MSRVLWSVLLIGLLFAPVAYAQPLEQEDICLKVEELPLSRPGTQEQPTKVEVNVYVINIENIDDITQTFNIDFVFGLRWQDPRLIHSAAKENQRCVYPLQKVWHPRMDIFNMRGIDSQLPKQVEVSARGQVRYIQRYYGRLSAHMNLHEFPFDHQMLPISFLSFGHGPQEMKLIFSAARTGHAKKFSTTNWRIEGGTPIIDTYKAESEHISADIVELVRFEYQFQAQRWLNYYVWKIFIPLLLIVFMSWAVFWVSPLKMEVQVGLAATTILTLIAFLFSISNLLPKISYLTIMDQFVLICLVFVFAAFIEAVYTCSLGVKKKIELALKIDRYARFVFPITFAVCLLAFAVGVFLM